MDKPFFIPTSIFTSYTKIGLNDQQFLLLMHIHQFSQEGNSFPTPNQLQERMGVDETECTNLLKNLIKRGFLTIEEEQDSDGRLSEAFSIKPLYEKMLLFLDNSGMEQANQTKQMVEGQLFRRFEEEFSRPLSPMEMEMISMWLDEDGHATEMIEAALRESVVSGKLSFRYIDRILFDWKKNGIRSVQQAKLHGERIRQKSKGTTSRTDNKAESSKVRHPHYNWLKPDKY
nr:DnaD domain-containing protein [Bacillus alkalicola]